MLFLSFVALVGIAFLLNTLWRLFIEPRETHGGRETAEIIRFGTRKPSVETQAGDSKLKSVGTAV